MHGSITGGGLVGGLSQRVKASGAGWYPGKQEQMALWLIALHSALIPQISGLQGVLLRFGPQTPSPLTLPYNMQGTRSGRNVQGCKTIQTALVILVRSGNCQLPWPSSTGRAPLAEFPWPSSPRRAPLAELPSPSSPWPSCTLSAPPNSARR